MCYCKFDVFVPVDKIRRYFYFHKFVDSLDNPLRTGGYPYQPQCGNLWCQMAFSNMVIIGTVNSLPPPPPPPPPHPPPPPPPPPHPPPPPPHPRPPPPPPRTKWPPILFSGVKMMNSYSNLIEIVSRNGFPVDNTPALGQVMASRRTGHYLDQWWPGSLTIICVNRGRCVNALSPVDR